MQIQDSPPVGPARGARECAQTARHHALRAMHHADEIASTTPARTAHLALTAAVVKLDEALDALEVYER